MVGGPEVLVIAAALFLGKKGLVYYEKRIVRAIKRPACPARYYAGVALMLVNLTLLRYLSFVLGFVLAGPQFWLKAWELLLYRGRPPERPEGRVPPSSST
jgi:hypothetical protein